MKLTKKLALSSALATALVGNAMANGMPAVDCCAALEKRVKRLEDKAVEGTTKKLYISGWVNRAVIWADDGVNSNLAHVDNDHSSSRIIIEGKADLNDDVHFGLRTVLNLKGHSTENFVPHATLTSSNAENISGTSTAVRLRRNEVFMGSKKFGTVTMGHGYYFTTANAHYGTWLSKDSVNGLPFTALEIAPFRNKTTGGANAPVLAVFAFNPGYAPSVSGRGDRIMYETPKWYGLQLGASHGYNNRGDVWDVGAKWAGKFGGWLVAAGVGYVSNQTRNNGETGAVGANGTGVTFEQVNAGVGVLAPFSFTGKDGTGVHLRYAFANRDYDKVNNKDGRTHIIGAAYQDMFTDLGMTTIGGNWGHYRNMNLRPTANQTVVGKGWGIGVQQNIDAVGTELYAQYTNMSLKIKNQAENYRDQDVILVGARVKF